MKNLRLILAVEIVLIVLVCIVVGGIFVYFNSTPVVPAVANPVATEVVSLPTETAVATIAAPVETSTPGMTGTMLEKQADGATRYMDYDAGFEITIPTGWLAVRPEGEEFEVALAQEGAKNQGLYNRMTGDKAEYEAQADRLFIYPLRTDLTQDFLGYGELDWIDHDRTQIGKHSLSDFVHSLEADPQFSGIRVTASSIVENPNQVSVIVVGARWTFTGDQGAVPLYINVLFFKPRPGDTVRVTLTYLQDFQGALSADVNAIVDSIKSLEQ